MSVNEAQRVEPDTKKQLIAVGNRGLSLQSLDDLWRFSNYVAKSGLAPKGMEKPETCLVAIQMGLEIGFAPMQAIQNIAVINNRPSVWGDSVKALVLATRECEDFHEWFEGDGDKLTAHCRIKRKGFSELIVRTFSIQDAKTAELWSKAGPWKQYPKRMLQIRARSWACRDAFPDALKGLFVAEEAQDIPRERIDVTGSIGLSDVQPIQATTQAAAHNTDNAPTPGDLVGRSITNAAIRELAGQLPTLDAFDSIQARFAKQNKLSGEIDSWPTPSVESFRGVLEIEVAKQGS